MPPAFSTIASSTRRETFLFKVAPLIPILITLAIASGCSNSASTSASQPTASSAADIYIPDPQVRQALAKACFDCHSQQGQVSWNAHFAPSYLFGKNAALGAVDFSNWGSYDAQKRKAVLARISEVVADGSMPPGDYELMHPGSKLSAADKQLVLEWAAGPPIPVH